MSFKIRRSTYGSSLEPLLKSSSGDVALEFDEDIDVLTERNRVLSGSTDSAIIYLRNLRKVFQGFFFWDIEYLVMCLVWSI